MHEAAVWYYLHRCLMMQTIRFAFILQSTCRFQLKDMEIAGKT